MHMAYSGMISKHMNVNLWYQHRNQTTPIMTVKKKVDLGWFVVICTLYLFPANVFTNRPIICVFTTKTTEIHLRRNQRLEWRQFFKILSRNFGDKLTLVDPNPNNPLFIFVYAWWSISLSVDRMCWCFQLKRKSQRITECESTFSNFIIG